MKKQCFVFLVLVAMMILWVVPAITAAQAPVTTGVYTVQPGDTGWELSRQYYDNATIWQRIVDMNPALQVPGRVFEKNGRIILLLKPGEQLFGLERLNVAPPTAVPIEQLVTPAPPVQTAKVVSNDGFDWSRLFIALVAIAVLLALIWEYRGYRSDQRQLRERELEMQRDPITSGTPYVPGGIAPTDAPRLENFFDQQATARYAERNPHLDRATIRTTRVGPIEDGTIVGEGMVGYLGGEMRLRRIETPIASYRARYRFPDGTEENLMTLQACMNPVNFGGDTYRGFTFTPRTVAVPTPEPERPAPQAVPLPAMAARMIRAAAQADGNTTVTISDRVLVFERGVHLTVDEATGAIGMEGLSFKMTLQPKRQRRERHETPRATGTSD